MTWFKMQLSAKDKTRAEIFIYEQIGYNWFDDSGITAKDFIQALKDLGDDVGEIDLHINSPGGVVFDGVAIHSALVAHAATVNVIVDGLAASIASVIAMAGDTITMTTGSMMMVHSPSTVLVGRFQADDLEDVIGRLEKVEEAILPIYANRTGQDRDAILELLKAETYMTAEEAVDFGFADELSEAPALAACMDQHDVELGMAQSRLVFAEARIETMTTQHEAEVTQLRTDAETLQARIDELSQADACAAERVIELCDEAGLSNQAVQFIRDGLSEAQVESRLTTIADCRDRLSAFELGEDVVDATIANINDLPEMISGLLTAHGEMLDPDISSSRPPSEDTPVEGRQPDRAKIYNLRKSKARK